MSIPSPSQLPESAFTFLSHGATIQEFRVGGQNIVLGFPEAKFYKTHNAPYFGETIGRTTNRVKDARIEGLNGRSYELFKNDGRNCLHGGEYGWGKKEFEGPRPVNRDGKEGVMFKYLSRDGDEGYPGTVEVRVWYTAGHEEGKTVLDVEYEVQFVGAPGEEVEETVVGVTNHRFVIFFSSILPYSGSDTDGAFYVAATSISTPRPPPSPVLKLYLAQTNTSS
jgi:aldose 1-epimerase